MRTKTRRSRSGKSPEYGSVRPGSVSPRLAVPAGIVRPGYADGSAPLRGETEVKTPEIIEAMRAACKLAAATLRISGEAVAPGVTTDAIDRITHDYIIDHGAYPSPLNYRGYPKSVCTSVNEVICHGIPDSTVLRDGDIVNIDVTVYIGGVHGDCNATFLVGDVDPETRRLVEVTKASMMRGIKVVKPGRKINVIGYAIQRYAEAAGFGVVRSFTGHGIGTTFHSGLVIPHYDDPRADTVMLPGMTFTIEPMLTLGDYDFDLWPDGWTAVTKDRKATAQFEHTILVTDTGHEILTVED
jgi:methionyl aminopeptidase